MNSSIFFDNNDNNRLICNFALDVTNFDIVSYWDEEYFDEANAYYDEEEGCYGISLSLKDVCGRSIDIDIVKGQVYND